MSTPADLTVLLKRADNWNVYVNTSRKSKALIAELVEALRQVSAERDEERRISQFNEEKWHKAGAALQCAREENEQWREMLWMNHGCERRMLYGDDGELQCSRCGVDFKRMSPEDIRTVWQNRTLVYLASRNISQEHSKQ